MTDGALLVRTMLERKLSGLHGWRVSEVHDPIPQADRDVLRCTVVLEIDRVDL